MNLWWIFPKNVETSQIIAQLLPTKFAIHLNLTQIILMHFIRDLEDIFDVPSQSKVRKGLFFKFLPHLPSNEKYYLRKANPAVLWRSFLNSQIVLFFKWRIRNALTYIVWFKKKINSQISLFFKPRLSIFSNNLRDYLSVLEAKIWRVYDWKRYRCRWRNNLQLQIQVGEGSAMVPKIFERSS